MAEEKTTKTTTKKSLGETKKDSSKSLKTTKASSKTASTKSKSPQTKSKSSKTSTKAKSGKTSNAKTASAKTKTSSATTKKQTSQVKLKPVLEETNVSNDTIVSNDTNVSLVTNVVDTNSISDGLEKNNNVKNSVPTFNSIKDDSSLKVENEPKKSLNDLFKDQKIKKAEIVSEDKALDHVEVMKKKIEASKKLKEEMKERTLINETHTQSVESVSINSDLDELKENDLIDNSKNIIKDLENTVNMLSLEVKSKDELINKQDIEIKEKDEKIIVLTNSIVSKTTEQELLKRIEELKLENEQLKEETNKQVLEAPKDSEGETNQEQNSIVFDINDPTVQEIISKGDILLRIKLLNERIAEKDAQIELVENELNELTESDIVAKEFKNQIRKIRQDRKDIVDISNIELRDLTMYIKSMEDKLNEKKALKESKVNEIKDFENNLKEIKLSYTEKEKHLSIKSRLIAECDSFFNEIISLEDEYQKLLNRYKKVLKRAEEKIEQYNELETSLISLYLKKLRDEKSKDDVNYQTTKVERNQLLSELEKLNGIYEEMKSHNLIKDNNDPEEVKAVEKEYAKVVGKLSMIEERYQERTNVEEVLRTIDPEVSNYIKAIDEIERLKFKLGHMQDANDLIKNDDVEKLKYYESISLKYEKNDKVIFYKQLLKSMDELKDKQQSLLDRKAELQELLSIYNEKNED